jgi:hypothetical protein
MAAEKANKIQKTPTSLPHIFLVDVDDSGLLKEVAIVNEFADGSLAYVDIQSLHQIDKGRIKRVVTGPHADKYPLYELLSQARFSNGINGLDYVHVNFVKIKRPKGARATQDSLANLQLGRISDGMIGADFVNPAESNLDQATKTFLL